MVVLFLHLQPAAGWVQGAHRLWLSSDNMTKWSGGGGWGGWGGLGDGRVLQGVISFFDHGWNLRWVRGDLRTGESLILSHTEILSSVYF